MPSLYLHRPSLFFTMVCVLTDYPFRSARTQTERESSSIGSWGHEPDSSSESLGKRGSMSVRTLRINITQTIDFTVKDTNQGLVLRLTRHFQFWQVLPIHVFCGLNWTCALLNLKSTQPKHLWEQLKSKTYLKPPPLTNVLPCRAG